MSLRATPATTALRMALVLVLAGSWVLGAAVAAGAAIVDMGFESPAPGARVEGPVQIEAYVDHTPPGRADRVETRFTRGGQVSGNAFALSASGESEGEGSRRSRFSATFDPLQSSWSGGSIAPNGRYVLEMRVRESYGDARERWTDWGSGHTVIVDAPPPSTEASASVRDVEARMIEVTWVPVGTKVPDFTRYTVERAEPDGSFQEVHRSADPGEGSMVDVVPADGSYHYRVTVHRAAAASGERSSAAETARVEVRQEERPAPDRTSAPRPDGTEAPGNGSVRGRSGPLVPSSRPGTLARPTRPGGQSSAPSSAPPGVGPSDVFEETLDYGDIPEGERTVTERRLVAGDPGGDSGGMLNIMDRELEPEQILVPIAAGLVFMMTALHVRRFMNP